MNANKKSSISSDWILCTSKSFPGKSYYFNVLTGEAVWTLNASEKNILKKENNIQKSNNNFHGYPEPTTRPDHVGSPPAVTGTNIWPNIPTSSHWQDYQRTYRQHTPMLNQYMPMPSTVMMPIQWPAPIWPYLAPDARRTTTDKITQTLQMDRFVHTSGIPLCQRFVNYEPLSLRFDKENKIINKFVPSTPNKSCKMELSEKGILEKIEAISTRSRTKSVDSFQNMEDSGLGLHKTDLIEDNLTLNELDISKENHSLNSFNKMNIDTSLALEKRKEQYIKKLDSSDLRFLLMAKRRKLQEELLDPIEKKKTKFQKLELPKNKQVSFDPKTLKADDSNLSEDNEKCINYPPAAETNTRSLLTSLLLPKITTNINKISVPDIPHHNTSTECMDSDIILTKDCIQNPTIINTSIKETTTGFNTESIMPTIKEYTERYVPTSNVVTGQKPMKSHYNNKSSNKLTNDHENSLSTRNMLVNEPVITTNVPILDEVSSLNKIKEVWYIVVDMDVLLDDHEIIEKVLQSYETCRLLIPASLRGEIEALCIGDCRGQQRVLVARHISRKMAVPHKQYVVEPLRFEEDVTVNTTDSILNCCIRTIKNNNYLVLITNDPYLLSRAKKCNVRCYTPQQIKNGAIINPKSFSDLKRLKVTFGNVATSENNAFIKNKISDIIAKREKSLKAMFEKQLVHNDVQVDKNCDILINITKPKLRNNNVYNSKYDNNTRAADICNQMQVLNIRNATDIKLNQKEKHKETQLQNQNAILSNKQFGNLSQNVKLSNIHSQNQRINMLNDFSKSNSDVSSEKPITVTSSYCQNHNSKDHKVLDSIKQNTSEIENKHITNVNKINNSTQENIITSAARHRIEKIISAVNLKSSKIKTENPIDANTTLKFDEIFKIPKLPSIKTATSHTSTPKRVSGATDQIRSNFKKNDESVEVRLKNFCMANKIIFDNIRLRIDEWICTYTQIMEEMLRDVLQLNCEYANKMAVLPINLHESLTCIKMLYDNARLRDVIKVLVELLMKHSCGKGKLKLDIKPQDFMKIVGCGVLLVETLKTIIRTPEVLVEYETCFDSLLHSTKSQRVDLDPELLRPTNVCRSEINNASTETRLTYRKEPTYVLNYLKKHYKEWSNYDENTHTNNREQKNVANQEDKFKVVRMFGKNVNMLKIDNNKSISYTEYTENAVKEKEETKIIRLLENKQTNLTSKNENIIEDIETGSKLKQPIVKPIVSKEDIFQINNISQIVIQDKEIILENHLSTAKEFENTHQNIDKEDLPTQKITLAGKDEISKPKKIRNRNLIDFVKNKEPLDLFKLDISDIITNISDVNDIIQYKEPEISIQHGKYISNNEMLLNNEDYAKNDDFDATRKVNQQKSNITVLNGENKNKTTNQDSTALKENHQNITHDNIICEDIISESNYTESVNIQEIYGSRKKFNINNNVNYRSEYQTFDENYAISNIKYLTNVKNSIANIKKEDYALDNNNYSTIDENYAIGKDDSSAVDENYASSIINYEENDENDAANRIMRSPRHDSMNDSGFENEGTQAYNVIKIFLRELSVTFKVIHEFIRSFVTEISGETLCEERKNILHVKACRCLKELVAIIQQLKSIIKRESKEVTVLKRLLVTAGIETATDTRVTRYRQIVRKCVEQAEILEGALRIIVRITKRDAISPHRLRLF